MVPYLVLMPKIKIHKDTVAFEGKFLSLVLRPFTGIHGKKGKWEMTQRKTFGDIVSIAAVTLKNELILEKIYRIPLKKYAIELPAGLCDRKGEASLALAKRELLEETGYTAETFIPVARGVFNAGRGNDRMTIYIAKRARRIQKPEYENAEDITVLKVPLSKLSRFLAHPPKNSEIDLKLFGVLYLLQKHGYRCP
jgi:ADP-ribose pyrophosphatase